MPLVQTFQKPFAPISPCLYQSAQIRVRCAYSVTSVQCSRTSRIKNLSDEHRQQLVNHRIRKGRIIDMHIEFPNMHM